MEATNKFVDFNQYDIESSRVNQDDIYRNEQFKFGGNMQINPNYKQEYQPTQSQYDQFQLPSAIKSPLSGHCNQSQFEFQQNLFGQRNLHEDSDNFLKDSNTGLPYNQPQRNLQHEDEDIIQMHNHNLNQEPKTGRFASNHNTEHIYDNQSTPIYNQEINKFKNQNDQIQQLLLQLQTPQQDPFTLNQNQAYTHFNQIQNQQQNHHYQRAMSQQILATQNQVLPINNQIRQIPNFDRINKDNSILELAKMKNSGNGSDSVTPQSANDNQDFIYNRNIDNNISRDASYIQNQQSNFQNQMNMDNNYPQYNLDNVDYFKMPNLNTNINTVGNSLSSYQKFTPQYNNQRNVSEYDQENIDQNIYQIHGGQMIMPKTEQSMIQQDPFPLKQQQIPQQIHYNNQLSELDHKRKEIMSKFDDIPIKVLNKAEGYQEKRAEDESENITDKDESQLSIIEKIDHPKWKLRMSAYKEINNLFYNEYSKDCVKSKSQQEQSENEVDEDGNPKMKPFEQYGPILHKIISDSNLVAQYEGLNCLFAFIKFSPDIKAVVFQISGILLEKIQHNKPNFKEITLKIIINIFKKDKSQSLLPEILKRFKNKNTKIATFAGESVVECLKSQLLNDDQTLKSLFKACQDNLGNPNKELKDVTIQLIQEIYKNCEDDINVFMKNLKNLRPIQQKDIKDILTDVQKTKNQVQLFQNQTVQAQTYTQGFSPKKGNQKVTEQDEDEDEQKKENLESDLLLLVPDNFYEIPYLTQINVKKKGMEAFNIELEKLVSRKQYCQIINKDYTQIFNVVTHMLEDSNALVFMEAIKTVEFLCIILGKNIKPLKMRQFIALLADKYKETKSGTITAVNKALQTIIKIQSLSMASLFEHMINTLAFNSKNARVKQLLLEKCDQTIQEETNLNQDEQQLLGIFKTIKDKVVGLIQKDTNASVRDAAVSLIATFKAYISLNNIVDETINALPKYRITEINKLSQERASNKTIQQVDNSNQNALNPKKLEKQLSNDKQEDFTYQGKNISGQYQIHLAEIILSLKKMAQSSNFEISTTQQKWDDAIENLGEQGVKESKPVIVSCVHWLFSCNNSCIKDNKQVIEMILGLVKKIYCIERNVETDSRSGQSKELDQALQLVLLCLKWISYKKQIDNILNVFQSSAATIQQFIDSIFKTFDYIKISCSKIELTEVIEYTFNWFTLKIDILLSKGMIYSDFEDLRGRVLSNYLEYLDKQELRDRIIQTMVTFKSVVSQSKNKMEHMADESSIEQNEDDQQDEEDKQQVSNIVDNIPSNNNNIMRNEFQLSELELKPITKSIGEQFIMIIDQDFQQGLQMIKSFQNNTQVLDFQNKEIIFNKVLKIVSNHTKNPVQKQQQAFSMKALLWMKEEIFGVEDCYKFTPTIMLCYAKAESEARDSSVELFLLNNWVKQLRLKDLIDRVSVTCSIDYQIFKQIFNWLMMNSLNGNQEEKWQIEDFRKISVLLAKNIDDDQVLEFFEMSVEKFTAQKVQDFMEIQLMHNQSDYNSFMSWFQNKYRPVSAISEQKERLRLPQINVDHDIANQTQDYRKINEDQQLREALHNKDNSFQIDESGITSTRGKQSQSVHSQLYQQLREKRKSGNQRKHIEDEGLNKYDQIINRLEVQLSQQQQDVQQRKHSPALEEEEQKQKEQNFQFYKSNASNYYYSEKSNRYQIVKTDEDDDLEDSQILKKQLQATEQIQDINYNGNDIKQDLSIENQNERLKESSIKESLWKQELDKLQYEKERIERERFEIMHAKNQETAEWREKYDEIKEEHEDVVNNLKEANRCYLTQVSENEDLKYQLKQMQDQHKLMMKKFDEFEHRLSQQQDQSQIQQQKQTEITVVTQEQLVLVEKVFSDYQVESLRGNEEIGTKKIQELLLNFDDKEETQRIGISLFINYQQLKTFEQKLRLTKALSVALESEDVLFALPLETYKTLLDYNLKVFAKEKALLEKNNIRVSSQSMQRGTNEQNEITVEAQKLVSKLLNSKEFTTSLVTLFSILRLAMPHDLSIDLSEEQKHYLRVVMRCISRISKALHSENPDLIRAFDVLIEMQKIFIKNPPESLREDLPCLQDFDYVYRGLKDVSDKLMELQPERVRAFLDFIKNQPPNAFIKYMIQVMTPKTKQRVDTDEDDYGQELYDDRY